MTELTNIKDLKFDDKNFNKHTEFGMSLLEKSLRNNGAGRSILLDKDNNIIAGNGIVEAAGSVGLDKVKIIEATGDEIVAVKRTDISLNSKQGREMALADNATASADLEWDFDALSDIFAENELLAYGIELPNEIDFDEAIEKASEGTVKEYSDDTDYNLSNLYRDKISDDILQKFSNAVQNGKIRPEIAQVIEDRIRQCSIFNFDELCKFYRSGDATEEEKELLERLYLVFLTPRQAFENGSLELIKMTGEIVDKSLMGGGYSGS